MTNSVLKNRETTMTNTVFTILDSNKTYAMIKDKDRQELKWHFPRLSPTNISSGTIVEESIDQIYNLFNIQMIHGHTLFQQTVDTNTIHVVHCREWLGDIIQNEDIRFFEIEELFELKEAVDQIVVELLTHINFYLRH